MELEELKIGLRVRVPAFEKASACGRKVYHYAYVRDIVQSLFGGESVVIVQIPVMKEDKAVSPSTLVKVRKPKKKEE